MVLFHKLFRCLLLCHLLYTYTVSSSLTASCVDCIRKCTSIVRSCQPLHFGRSLLRPWALHYTATIMITTLSLRDFFWFIFNPMRACGHQIHQQLVAHVPFFVSEVSVVPQPIGVRILTGWPVVVFSSIPALMHHFLVRRLPFSIISNCHAEAPGWWISPEKRTPKFLGRVLYRKVSVHCTINTEHPACEVQHLVLPFLGPSCRPWRNVRHRTMHQLEVSHQQRKSDRNYAEDFPFYGLWDAVLTAFWRNSCGDAFYKFLCSAQHRSLQPIMTSVLVQVSTKANCGGPYIYIWLSAKRCANRGWKF